MNAPARLLCPLCGEPLERPPHADAVDCPRCHTALDVAGLATARGRPRFVAQADLAGQSLGPYRLDSLLGAGGAGTVYRATSSTGETVALKVLDPSLARDEAARARFRREAALLGDLDHPSVVRLCAHGEDAGLLWLAMEFVDGPDLRARLRRGPLDRAEAAALFAALLDGLAYAHGRGVVHRDIKPGNILLGPSGPKIADFGIARLGEGPAGAALLTATEAILGTLLYMAPEQRESGAVDARADLFSVGVVLYEALTGRLPQGAFAPPSKVVAGLPARIDAVVHKLLSPDPAGRFPDAQTAARAIERALAPRRASLVIAAAGTTFTAAAALAFILLRPAAPPAKPPAPPVEEKQPPAPERGLDPRGTAGDAPPSPVEEPAPKPVVEAPRAKARAKVTSKKAPSKLLKATAKPPASVSKSITKDAVRPAP